MFFCFQNYFETIVIFHSKSYGRHIITICSYLLAFELVSKSCTYSFRIDLKHMKNKRERFVFHVLKKNPQKPLKTYVTIFTDLRRVCYHTNWAQYRNGACKFFPENIDPQLCTHIIYSFAKIENNQLRAYEWNDESTPWMKGM